MRIIGITGGVGSGKSAVLNYIGKNFDATVLQADEAAHLLMQPGKVCYRPLIDLLGNGITDACGDIDRRKMAAVIFCDESMRTKVNAIVHPKVKAYIQKAIEREREMGTDFFFIEAALLIEDHYDEICDELWYVFAEEDIRRERLRRDRGYSDKKIDDIMGTQLSEETFSEKCDFEIDNSKSLEETIRQITQRMNTYETL